EAARAAVQAPLPASGTDPDADDQAKQRGEARGQEVARGYGLKGVDVDVNARNLSPGSWVVARVTFDVSSGQFPYLRLPDVVKFSGQHSERVDPNRNRGP